MRTRTTIRTGLAESPLLSNGHGGFGKRPGETDRPKDRHRAPGRLREQAIALLHWFRRLRIRWEIRDDIHEAFLTLACAIICWRRLKTHALC